MQVEVGFTTVLQLLRSWSTEWQRQRQQQQQPEQQQQQQPEQKRRKRKDGASRADEHAVALTSTGAAPAAAAAASLPEQPSVQRVAALYAALSRLMDGDEDVQRQVGRHVLIVLIHATYIHDNSMLYDSQFIVLDLVVACLKLGWQRVR